MIESNLHFSDSGSLDPILSPSLAVYSSMLTRYSKDLKESLNRLHHLSFQDWDMAHHAALSLCHQMNQVKKEAKAAPGGAEDGMSLNFYFFLGHIKEVHQRLYRLKPTQVLQKKLKVNVSKYFYHKKQIKTLKKRLWRDLTRKLFKKGLLTIWATLKKEVIQEISHHQVEMQSAALKVTSYMKEIELISRD